MRGKKYFAALALTSMLASCDSGNIPDKGITVQSSGKVVKLTATVSGLSDWNGQYNVAVAAFADGNKFALTQKVIPENTPDGQHIAVVLENLSAEVNTVELALTNKLRKRILTIASMNIDEFPVGGDTIRMELGTLSLDMTGSIRHGVFDVACIQCHGLNGRAAAGLDLTKDLPPADKMEAILDNGGADVLHYNHTDVLSSHFKNNLEELKTLLHEWVETLTL